VKTKDWRKELKCLTQEKGKGNIIREELFKPVLDKDEKIYM